MQAIIAGDDEPVDEPHALHAAVHLARAAPHFAGRRLDARRYEYVAYFFHNGSFFVVGGQFIPLFGVVAAGFFAATVVDEGLLFQGGDVALEGL